MLTNAFIGRDSAPTEADTDTELGRAAKELWDSLIDRLAAENLASTKEGHSYSRKAGWSLRLKRADRTILYLIPSHGAFSVAFALGDKAVKAAHAIGLPKRVLRIIDSSRRYAEGTGVRLDVNGPDDVEAVLKLAGVKAAN